MWQHKDLNMLIRTKLKGPDKMSIIPTAFELHKFIMDLLFEIRRNLDIHVVYQAVVPILVQRCRQKELY